MKQVLITLCLALTVLCALAALQAGLETPANAQGSCGPVTNPPITQSSTILVRTPDGSCTLDSGGGFVKYGATYKLHIIAAVTGSCTTLVMLNGQCVNSTVYTRTIGTSRLLIDGNYVGGIGASPLTVQSYDTTVPTGTTSTGSPWVAVASSYGGPGEHVYSATTNANLTVCSISPSVFPASNTVPLNVVMCKPEWHKVGSQTMHFPQTTIYVYINRSETLGGLLWVVAPEVENDWNYRLSGAGVHIQMVDVDCGTGSDCVKVSSSDDIPTGCADFTPTNVDIYTGAITGYSNLRLFDEYWPYATLDRLRRTLAHELTHGLSMDHNLCSLSDSLMSVPQVPAQFASQWDACTHDTGMTTSPQVTDYLPTAKATYGNHIEKVCGF